MKLTNLFAGFAVAGAMILAAGKASAIPVQLPTVKLNISGTIVYNASSPDDNGKSMTAKATQLKINIKSLIELLNASTNVQTTLSDLGLPTQIPDGSYFIWNLGNSFYDSGINTTVNYLTITNKSGFSFDLAGYDSVLNENYAYGYLDIDQEELVGMSFSQNDSTGAGSETDLTGDEIYFDDGVGDSFDSYGNAALKWSFGKVDGGFQKTTLKANLSAPEGYEGGVGSAGAMTLANLKISGSGEGDVAEGVFPFYLWW